MLPALKAVVHGWKGEKGINGRKNVEAAHKHKRFFPFYNYRVSIRSVNS
jgi:hypothetical protein